MFPGDNEIFKKPVNNEKKDYFRYEELMTFTAIGTYLLTYNRTHTLSLVLTHSYSLLSYVNIRSFFLCIVNKNRLNGSIAIICGIGSELAKRVL